MKIKTITCHDVYNAGASLQAYALMKYLQNRGHDVKIINYKPPYLSHHYDLFYVPNPKYNHGILKIIYIVLKLPQRLISLKSKKKKDFDDFTHRYLSLTSEYTSCDEMINQFNDTDIFITGSDQIWNPIFKNGYDPSFYLQFAPSSSIKASYAASFAIEVKQHPFTNEIKNWLSYLDKISVREKSGLEILSNYNISGALVLDPVFLLDSNQWNKIALKKNKKRTIFVNDFDENNLIKDIALKLADRYNAIIVSLQHLGYEDEILDNQGPIGFLTAIRDSVCVISNSFHATAFSLIYHTEFYVVNRCENINTRMKDLLSLVGLSNRLISSVDHLSDNGYINWNEVDQRINKKRNESIEYIYQIEELSKKR